MSFPKSVVDAIEEASAAHPNNVPDAVQAALEGIRALPEYAEAVENLIRTAVRNLVYDARHRINVEVKRSTGYYGAEAKVVAGKSDGAARAAIGVYLYHIAGRTLGDLRGEELAGIARRERAKSDGHLFNASLCEELRKKVADGKRVRDVVGEGALKTIFQRVHKNVTGQVA